MVAICCWEQDQVRSMIDDRDHRDAPGRSELRGLTWRSVSGAVRTPAPTSGAVSLSPRLFRKRFGRTPGGLVTNAGVVWDNWLVSQVPELTFCGRENG